MATWEQPIDSQTDPDAPITANLAKRWDNNVIALAEGASGAPRVARGAIKTATASVTGSIPATSGTRVNVGLTSFFPDIRGVNLQVQGTSGSADADTPGFTLYNPTALNLNFTVAWRYFIP